MNAAPPPAISPELRRRRRLQLVLLALLFFGPLAVSFWLYYGAGWRPEGRVNYGDLVDPARPLPEVSLARPDGARTGPGFLRGKWSLVYFGRGDCDAACRAALEETRQIRLAMDRDATRIQRVFLFDSSCCDRAFLESEHPDLVVAWLDERDGARLLEPFPAIGGTPAREAGRIWLVDPLGNLLMSYPAGPDKRAVVKDLEKLLKLSHIG